MAANHCHKLQIILPVHEETTEHVELKNETSRLAYMFKMHLFNFLHSTATPSDTTGTHGGIDGVIIS